MKIKGFLQPRHFSLFARNAKKVSAEQLKTKTKNVSSQHWLSRQLSDPYVERAKMMNYRCRSAFKLIEIDDRYRILQPGFAVVDCGAAPGSWTQVAVKRVNSDSSDKERPRGKVLAIDRQLIYPIEGATIFGNMDFTQSDSQNKLLDALEGKKVDAVVSDMAPNATGIRDMDNENIMKLCYSVLRFAVLISRTGASVLVKLWQNGEMKLLQSDAERFYRDVRVVKPKASRADSTEIFMLGRDFKGLALES